MTSVSSALEVYILVVPSIHGGPHRVSDDPRRGARAPPQSLALMLDRDPREASSPTGLDM